MDERTGLIFAIGAACIVGLKNRRLRRQNADLVSRDRQARRLAMYFANVLDRNDVEFDEFDKIVLNDFVGNAEEKVQ